jgi:5-methylcytosine-specific restriction endonuclease McrA
MVPECLTIRKMPLPKHCVYCGGPFENRDHLMPKRRRLTLITVPSCSRCNSMKGNMLAYEFFEHMKKVLAYMEEHYDLDREGRIMLKGKPESVMF